MRDTREVRATGLQGDASPEMIEIIDDDTDPFGDRASDTNTDIVRRRRAALGRARRCSGACSADRLRRDDLCIVDGNTEGGAGQHHPACTEDHPAAGADDHDRLPQWSRTTQQTRHESSRCSSPSSSIPSATPSKRTATTSCGPPPDASGGSGSWFSIHSLVDGSNSLYAVDAYRVQPGDQPMAISHTRTGQSVVQFSVNRTVSITLTAFGWSDPDLVQLAQSVIADDGDVSLADPSLIDGYQLITSVQPWLAVQGRPAEQIFYASNTNPGRRGIGLSVALRPPTNAGGATLDRQIALRFLLDHATPFDVDGHLGVAGVTTGQGGFALASWIAGDHIVTVSAAMSVPELIAVARTVHEVSFEEWNGMQFQAARYNSDNNFGKYQETEPRPVSFGTDAAGQEWSIEVSIVTYPKNRELTWQWDGNLFGDAIDDTAEDPHAGRQQSHLCAG